MGKSHTYILTYMTEEETEGLYEFSAYSYEQAALFADMYCKENHVVFIDLELSCVRANRAV